MARRQLEDLNRYQVQWSEPASGAFQGYEIRISPTSAGAQPIREALNLIENSGLANQLPYSNNADALLGLSRILTWVMISSNVPAVLEGLHSFGVDISPAGRLTPAYAKAVAPVLATLFTAPVTPTPPPASNHSASVVVVDPAGNVAALVHTSNTVAWGSTGLVVGGIPIPEAAGLAALRFPTVKPGERIPHDMAPLIAFEGGAHAADVLARLRTQGVTVKESSPAEVIALRGTAAVARMGGASPEPQTAEVPGVFVFAMGY